MPVIGAPTTRAHFPAYAERNLRHHYLVGYNGSDPPLYPQLFSMDTMDEKIVREAVAAGLGTYPSAAEGSSITYDSGQQFNSQSYTALTYRLGVEVTLEAIEDDIHGVVRALTGAGKALGVTAKYTKERDAMAVFNTYLTSGTLFSVAGSNYALLSASHALADGSTWSNTPGGSPDLSYEALEYAIAHWMANQVDPRGLKTTSLPSVLLVGVSNWGMAHRVLKTYQRMPGSANNDVNAVADQFNIKPIVHKLLTDDGRWLLLAPQDPEYGIRYYDRIKPGVIAFPDSDTGNKRWVGRYRCVSGATHAFGTWGVS